MAEHYTKNTLECTAWCAKCGRMTQHRVDSGRRGPCIDPNHPEVQSTKKQIKAREQREREAQQPALFGAKR